MRWKAIVSCCLIVLTLSGCAPMSPQQLREEASGKKEFTVPIGYQEAYRRVVAPMRRCFQSSGILLGPSVRVESDLYTDEQRGQVALSITGLDTRVTILVEITAQGASAAKVVTHYWLDWHQYTADMVQRWVVDQYDQCAPPAAPLPPPSNT